MIHCLINTFLSSLPPSLCFSGFSRSFCRVFCTRVDYGLPRLDKQIIRVFMFHRKGLSRNEEARCNKEGRKVLRINGGLTQQHWPCCIVLVALLCSPLRSRSVRGNVANSLPGPHGLSFVGIGGNPLFLFDIIGWIMMVKRANKRVVELKYRNFWM